ncbi:hypothetical protein IscW_ISCW018422 [Ixodes scapularis]|uniref:Uncharacterized protein n=1 Tax=Ixodes scapularis TaxID=6945 RepID=B7PEP4_IXOSC|nr:hypothetical protein IscW_ISCW018422 [Ixodes scapularis]|eukprot:XP_002433666.1 hypothetical protein IscW_ISCW018422 [Ixodes scapularis]
MHRFLSLRRALEERTLSPGGPSGMGRGPQLQEDSRNPGQRLRPGPVDPGAWCPG